MATVEIPLSQGLVTVVDEIDAHYGQLRWHASRSGRSSGTFYAIRNGARRPDGTKEKSLVLHRVILNAPDDMMVDHMNGNGLDNRRANLRLVDASGNMLNRGRARRDSASGIVGVTYHTRNRRWMASIRVRGMVKHLGYFDTADQANIARLLAERDACGIQPRRLAAFIAAGLA
jgi:hypothetical protein